MIPTVGYAALAARGDLQAYRFERRELGDTEVLLDILRCGLCHSDVHMVDDDWGFSPYPLVPGHEIVGRVRAVGPRVDRFGAGDIAAIGCMIGSCRVCRRCEAGLEQYCDAGPTSTFGGYEPGTQRPIHGGFSSCYVVDQRFAVSVPKGMDIAAAAPLLCAGITTYSPLRHWKVGRGSAVGVVGIGGLGHLAIKFARAMGAEVLAITSSAAKRGDALKLGAHEAIVSGSSDVGGLAGRLDFVLDTVSADHDIAAMLDLLRTDGTLCMLGIPKSGFKVPPMRLETKRKSIAGSIMGGMAETQDMLNFAAAHGIGADVEVMSIERINEAIARLKRNDVRYRFVLDTSSLGA
jgi:alcohol dehydrogenase (NADP+)